MNSAPLHKRGRVVRAAARRRGFTLIEAMAAVVILGIGIVGSVAAFGSLAHSEANARQTEKMVQLAKGKLAELVATGQATTAANGDFTDQNEPGYTWDLQVNTSDVTDLDTVTISVNQTNTSKSPVKIDTLIYVPPATTATTGATQ